MENELIQWPRAKYWTKAFNPVVGCKKISEGCQNCYAERITEKFGINGGSFAPEVMLNAKAPQSGVVFVGNMTDIFGIWNKYLTICRWMRTLSHEATNLVLTKRADRLNEFAFGLSITMENHLWFGVTCENQQRADERTSPLLESDVQHRWLSLEPLLSDITFPVDDFSDNGHGQGCLGKSLNGKMGVEWVVVGAESGPNRRECKIEWIEHIVEQCQAAGVPVFVKQIHIDGKLVDDINKFPEHLRIRQVPWQTVSK
jgi:protein gp37